MRAVNLLTLRAGLSRNVILKGVVAEQNIDGLPSFAKSSGTIRGFPRGRQQFVISHRTVTLEEGADFSGAGTSGCRYFRK
jgi:hypothetical protein